jgi:diacylglycerol kinase family enzyme
MRAAVIINPVAGVRRAPSAADRVRLAAEVLASRGIDADIHVTHGRATHATLRVQRSIAERSS